MPVRVAHIMQRTTLQQSTYRWVCFPTMEEATQAIYQRKHQQYTCVLGRTCALCVCVCVSTTQIHLQLLTHTKKTPAFSLQEFSLCPVVRERRRHLSCIIDVTRGERAKQCAGARGRACGGLPPLAVCRGYRVRPIDVYHSRLIRSFVT